MDSSFFASFFVGAGVMLLLSIAIMRSAYFTIPRLKREELQSTLKLELQQKLMDISAEEADLLAQVMVEVLDGLS